MNVDNQLLSVFGSNLKTDVVLAPYTTFKIGGPADYFIEATNTDDLCHYVMQARNLHLPFFILGGGSNILISDRGFRGLVIRNITKSISIKGAKGSITSGVNTGQVFVEADSGVPFNYLVRYTIEEGLGGLEMHLGLPGSVGGAIYMNSKWMQPPAFVGDVVYQGTILTKENEKQTVSKDYFHFQYGYSTIQKTEDILLSIVFQLTRQQKELLWERANESISYRKKTQPQGEKTAGCIFKNITPAEAIIAQTPNHTTSTGYLIDHAGCKQFKVGGVGVSDMHANFIVNTGSGTSSDVLQLIDSIQDAVYTKFGIHLQEEIIRVGDFS